MDRPKRLLIEYYNYYCITDNSPTVGNYFDKLRRLLFKWMNRRSQKKFFNWDKVCIVSEEVSTSTSNGESKYIRVKG